MRGVVRGIPMRVPRDFTLFTTACLQRFGGEKGHLEKVGFGNSHPCFV